MNALEVFRYDGAEVRTILIDGAPWFSAVDVCGVLEIGNVSQAMTRLDDDERTLISNEGRELNVVSEAGLFSLILGSRKPEARAFKRWVTHDVLPAIRRTGSYGVRIPGTYAEALEAAAAQARRAEALEAKAVEDAPKVLAYDALIDSDGYYSMEELAKLGNIGRTTLFRRLREAGVIQPGSRLPYQRYMHWFKITTAAWGDPRTGPSGVSETPRVRPEALTKVLAKAGITFEAVRP